MPCDNGCVNCCIITIDNSDRDRFTSDLGLSLSDPDPLDFEFSGYFRYFKDVQTEESADTTQSHNDFKAFNNTSGAFGLSNRFTI